MNIIDITQELFSSHVYPGDKPPTFERVRIFARDRVNLTNIAMSVHNGTHVDAPKHFVDGGKAIHELDLAVFHGECTVVEFEGVIEARDITGALRDCKERLLIKGRAELSESAAAVIANSHVKLIGVEGQSVGSDAAPQGNHVILLEKGIIPLEGLVLSHVSPGEYVLSAFPLCLQDSDGSPVRAVLFQ